MESSIKSSILFADRLKYSLKNEILLIQKVRAGELQLPIDCLQDEIDADINTLWRCGKITDAESVFLKKVLDV